MYKCLDAVRSRRRPWLVGDPPAVGPPPALPPPCAQGGGRERPVSNTFREHRWASSLSSFYSEFFVEKWSTKSSITRSSWYVVPSTPCKNAPRRSLLTAKSAFHVREKSYSIVMEVTCHLPGPFQQEGLNFSSWRAPQETPWLAVQPLTSERLTLASADKVVLTSSFFNYIASTLQHLQQHLHTLPRKCVEWQWTLKLWKTFATRDRVIPPSSSFSVDPNFCVTIPI
jgi:hypothetical protein